MSPSLHPGVFLGHILGSLVARSLDVHCSTLFSNFKVVTPIYSSLAVESVPITPLVNNVL